MNFLHITHIELFYSLTKMSFIRLELLYSTLEVMLMLWGLIVIVHSNITVNY